MNIRTMTPQIYRRPADEDGGDSGGGVVSSEHKTYTQEDVDKLVAEQVAGLKSKNSQLLGEHKKFKEQLSRFEGIDPDSVRAILANFADQQEAKLIAEGKIDEVMAKRAERMKAGHDKEVSKLQGDMETLKQRAAKFAERALSAAVRETGAQSGIHPSAYDDALLRAKSVFDVDDEGNAAARDGVFGKDGRPLTLKEWFAEMRDTAPHWFLSPSGGGSHGGSAGTSGVPKSLAQCKSDEERVAYLKSIAHHAR